MKKKNGVNYTMHVDAIVRRKNVIERLNSQLKQGKKNVYNRETKKISVIKLTDADIKRINKEIEILNKRI